MCKVEEVVAEDIGKVAGESKPVVERWEKEKQSRAVTVPFVTSTFAWLKRWSSRVSPHKRHLRMRPINIKQPEGLFMFCR